MQNCCGWILGIGLVALLFIVIPIAFSGGDKKEQLKPIFDNYIEKFNKTYKDDPVEYEARLKNFMVSYDEIEKLNSQSRGPEEHRARYGFTPLSDMSLTEYQDIHLSDEQVSVRPNTFVDKFKNTDYYAKYYTDLINFFKDFHADKPPKNKTKLAAAKDLSNEHARHDYYYRYYKDYFKHWMTVKENEGDNTQTHLKIVNDDVNFPKLSIPLDPEDKAAIHDYYYNYYKDYFSFWMDFNASKPPKNKTATLKLSYADFPELKTPLSPEDKAAIHDYYYNYYKDYFSYWIDINANKPPKETNAIGSLENEIENNVFPKLSVPLSPEDKATIHDYYYNYYKDYFSYWIDVNANKPPKDKMKSNVENIKDFPVLSVPLSVDDKAAIHDYYYNYYKDYFSFWIDMNANKPPKDKAGKKKELKSGIEDNFPILSVPLSPEDKDAIHDYYYNYYKDYFSFWLDVNSNKPPKDKKTDSTLKSGIEDNIFPNASVPLSPEDKDAIHDYYYNYYKDYFSFWMDINANKPPKDKEKDKTKEKSVMETTPKDFPKLTAPMSPVDRDAINDYYYNYYKDYFSFWADINANKPPKNKTKLQIGTENDMLSNVSVPLSPEEKDAIHDYYYNYYKDYFSFWMDINANKPPKDKTKEKSGMGTASKDFPELTVPMSPVDRDAISDYYYNYYKDYFSFWADINANKPAKNKTKLQIGSDNDVFANVTLPLSPEDKDAIHDYYYNYYKDYFSFWMDINANKPPKDKSKDKTTPKVEMENSMFTNVTAPLSPEDKATIHDYYYNYYKDYFAYWKDINANKPAKETMKEKIENDKNYPLLSVPLSPDDKDTIHDYYYNYYKDYFSFWMDINANKPPKNKLTLGEVDFEFDKLPSPANEDDKVAMHDYYFNYYKDYFNDWMEVNEDKVTEEKANKKNMYNAKLSRSGPVYSRRKRSDLPLQVDWRAHKVISPVKNQGVCGACWAFSTIGAMEAINAIKTGTLERLSVQEMIDCARLGNSGCAGGDICLLLNWLLKTGTAVTKESEYPLSLKDGVCSINKNTTGVKLKSFTCDDFVGREDMILQTLATHGPVAVAVNALTWQHYLGGVVQYNCDGSPSQLNHAVELVGYDLTGTVPYYIAKNSWGPEFGNNGYIYLAVGNNMCGLANEVGIVDVK